MDPQAELTALKAAERAAARQTSPATTLPTQSAALPPGSYLVCAHCERPACGRCPRCSRAYCRDHGNVYCLGCLQLARQATPTGLALVAKLLRAAAVAGVIGAAVAGGGAAVAYYTGATAWLTGSLGAVGALALGVALLGAPLYWMGAALRRGARWALWLTVLTAVAALFAFPLGTLLGILVLRALLAPKTQLWFEVRNIPLPQDGR